MAMCLFFFFFKQKTAYEMRISDWSSDVCSSDLRLLRGYERGGKPTASGDALGAGFGQLRLGQLGAILGGGGAASLGQGCQHRLLGDGPEKFDTAFPMVAHIEIGGAGNPEIGRAHV